MTVCGSLRMKPTVSVRRRRWRFGSWSCRVRGIERGEELVLGENTRAGEAIEKRGFACVRVTDERSHGPIAPQAALALDGAILADGQEVAFEPGDAVLHAAAVDFELGLARAARADSAALAGEVRPHAGEARGEGALQLRELDLEAALARARALGKDVEDELRAVEHLAVGQFLKIAPLRGRARRRR